MDISGIGNLAAPSLGAAPSVTGTRIANAPTDHAPVTGGLHPAQNAGANPLVAFMQQTSRNFMDQVLNLNVFALKAAAGIMQMAGEKRVAAAANAILNIRSPLG
jgi:hypothetical protein